MSLATKGKKKEQDEARSNITLGPLEYFKSTHTGSPYDDVQPRYNFVHVPVRRTWAQLYVRAAELSYRSSLGTSYVVLGTSYNSRDLSTVEKYR
eukprot:scaffold22896_cov44-Attheya_sp.AAC.1